MTPVRRLTFALAGYLPPLVAPLDGLPVMGARPGPPLGVGYDGVRAPRDREPAGRDRRALHRRPDRGPPRAIDDGSRHCARRWSGRSAAARRGLRPRAAPAGARRRRRGRHRAAGLEPPADRAVLEPGEAGLAAATAAGRATRSLEPCRSGGGGAHLEAALPRERHRGGAPAARFALDLDAPARRGGSDVPSPAARVTVRANGGGERDRLAAPSTRHRGG